MTSISIPTRLPRQRSVVTPVGAALVALMLAVVVAAAIGKTSLPIEMQLQIVAYRLGLLEGPVAWPASAETILLDIRLPRIALAAVVGAGLAVAGTSYQGLFRNPLAEPYLLGVASGAALGAVIAMAAPLPAAWYGLGIVQLAAFVGATIVVTAVYMLGRVGGTAPVTMLLLAGIALGALLNAATTYLMYLHGDKLLVIYAWLVGGFNVASWQQVWLVSPGVIAAIAIIALCSRGLNLLQVGEEQAASLGLDVERTKLLLTAAATLATASAVSAAGLIGFVGLIVPHTIRLLVGPDHRLLVPVAAIGGAAFLIFADTLARSLPGSVELPVGVLTAACGAPFFLVLLRRQKRGLL